MHSMRHCDRIDALAYAPATQTLAAASVDGSLVRFSLPENGTQNQCLMRDELALWAVDMTTAAFPDGQIFLATVAIGQRGIATVFAHVGDSVRDLHSTAYRISLGTGSRSASQAIRVQTVAVSAAAGVVRVVLAVYVGNFQGEVVRHTIPFAVQNGEIQCEENQMSSISYRGHQGYVLGLDVLEQPGVLATCGDDATIAFWNLRSGKRATLARLPTVHAQAVRIVLVPAWRAVAAACEDGSLRVFRAQNGECSHACALDEPLSGIAVISYDTQDSPEDRNASISSVESWFPANARDTASLLAKQTAQSGSVVLAAASRAGNVYFVRCNAKGMSDVISCSRVSSDPIHSCVWCPNERVLVCALEDGSLRNVPGPV